MDNMSMFATPNQFQYSAVSLNALQSTEYTLVNILVDESGSVSAFETDLNKCLGTIVDACKKHPRSGSLLVRVAAFADIFLGAGIGGIREIHGFNTLGNIDTSKYKGQPNGGTPLYDASFDAVETTGSFAKTLTDQDYFVNGIFFVITDGGENASKVATVDKIKNALTGLRSTEALESVKAILIGVNANGMLNQELTNFKNDAGFDEYISIDDASAGKLAKLAKWVSQSISSTSQALGSGGPSQSVSFTI